MKIKQLLILSAGALSLAACGEHTHSFGEAWKSDETSHWHECECGEKSEKADHLDTNTDGKCDVCNHDMEVPTPTPTGTEVTKEEWEAAFGLEKPYKIAENYKIDMEIISEDELKIGSSYRSLSVDGLKARKIRAKNAGEHDIEYTLKTQNGFTSYFWNEGQQKWEINEEAGDPTNEFASFLTPFGSNFDKFNFDDSSKSYKCLTLDVGGTICTNMSIKFENKKIVSASLESAWKMGTDSVNYHWQSAITYGGQIVTLPEIDPEPAQGMTEDEFNALVNIVNNVGLSILAKNTPMVEGVQIPEASSHTTYKYNVENEAYYLCTVDSDGSTSESKVVNQVSYYSHNGEPYQVRDLTPEQAHNNFIEARAEAMAALLPSTDFSDYVYDSINDNYRVEISFEYDGIAVEEVLFYEMNADGITSVKGTSTATFEGRTMNSFLEVKNIVLGPQEIIA